MTKADALREALTALLQAEQKIAASHNEPAATPADRMSEAAIDAAEHVERAIAALYWGLRKDGQEAPR